MLEILADTCRVRGRLDMQNGAALLGELLALSDKTTAKVLKLDVSQLESADSLLLAAMLEVSRRLASVGGGLRVTGLPVAMTGLARAYGIESLIEFCVES